MEKKKNLIRFNVRNVKYALPDDKGGFLPFVDMGTSTKLALEVDSSTKDIYGDGRRIIHYVNEKGKTGTLTQNNICDEYEIAMGRKIKTAKGLADIKPTKRYRTSFTLKSSRWTATTQSRSQKLCCTALPLPARRKITTKRPTILTSRRLNCRSLSTALPFCRQTARFTRTKKATRRVYGS